MQIHESNVTSLKYADDKVRGKEDYFEHIDSLVAWCKESALSLNALKTKELVSTREGQPTSPGHNWGPTCYVCGVLQISRDYTRLLLTFL